MERKVEMENCLETAEIMFKGGEIKHLLIKLLA